MANGTWQMAHGNGKWGGSEMTADIGRLAVGLSLILAAGACDSTYPPTHTPLPAAPTVAQPQPGRPTGSGPTSIPGTSIAFDGNWLCEDGDGDLCVEEGNIAGNEPACFVSWDASGVCKEYDLVAPADGVLFATMKWAGPSRGLYDPDVFLVAPDGTWAYAPEGWPEKQVNLQIRSGQTFRIVVLSYASALQFRLMLRIEQR
jgi:hypothetical protein